MHKSTATVTSEAYPAPQVDPRRWMALILILLPTLLISLNNYIDRKSVV